LLVRGHDRLSQPHRLDEGGAGRLDAADQLNENVDLGIAHDLPRVTRHTHAFDGDRALREVGLVRAHQSDDRGADVAESEQTDAQH